MNTKQAAAALNTISLAFAELAEAIHSPEPVSSGGPVVATDSPPVAAPASSMPEFPPLEAWEEAAAAPAAPPVDQREYVLGRCSVHDKPWTVKEGGVSKAGKPYGAFWRCNEKDANGYCSKKPDPSWIKTHNPEGQLVGA